MSFFSQRRFMLLTGALLFAAFSGFKPLHIEQEIKNRKVLQTMEAQEGDGARVKRLFPTRGFKHHDPFVMMDEFFVTPPAGFPTHPHRGFEAITYMVGGSFNHQDNLGNNSTVGPGGAQRFTAGRGMWHSETPGVGETAHGLQLWINLAQSKKQIAPSYQEVKSGEIPVEIVNGVTVRQIVGKNGPVQLQTEVDYRDIDLPKNSEYNITLEQGYGGYLYLMNGAIRVDDVTLQSGQALFLELSDNLTLKGMENSRVFLISGKPHNEPIRQRGPFVD